MALLRYVLQNVIANDRSLNLGRQARDMRRWRVFDVSGRYLLPLIERNEKEKVLTSVCDP